MGIVEDDAAIGLGEGGVVAFDGTASTALFEPVREVDEGPGGVDVVGTALGFEGGVEAGKGAVDKGEGGRGSPGAFMLRFDFRARGCGSLD